MMNCKGPGSEYLKMIQRGEKGFNKCFDSSKQTFVLETNLCMGLPLIKKMY